MKTLLILFALLALSFATFNTQWTTCDTASDPKYIQHINATITKNATKPLYTVRFCGKALQNMLIDGYSIETFFDDSWFAITARKEYSDSSRPVHVGEEFCHDAWTAGYFINPANYTFQIQLTDWPHTVNCLNVTLIVPPKPTQKLF